MATRKTETFIVLFQADGTPLPLPWAVNQQAYAKLGPGGTLVPCVITSLNPLAFSTLPS